MNPNKITVSSACARWGCGKTKLYELIGTGEIEAVKLGSRTLIDVQSGDQFFASLPRAGGRHRDARTDSQVVRSAK